MSNRLKIVFAGTPEFAASALDALLKHGFEIIAVYTQPDRPAGRGRKLTPSAVKQLALDHQIPVYQPLSLKDPEAQQELKALAPDIMVVAAYGLILPKAVLQIPRHGCINIHASLLPRWRGAAPIQRAMIAGDPETGITIMQMDKGLDTGDMLLVETCPIKPYDTGQTLHDRLAEMGGRTIIQVMEQFTHAPDSIVRIKQDDGLAIYAKKLDKAEAEIDWRQSAVDIDRTVRAFNPWPVASTYLDKEVLRCWFTTTVDKQSSAAPGTIISANKEGIDVATGDGVLRLLMLQLPGKKVQDAAVFVNAYPLSGKVLG